MRHRLALIVLITLSSFLIPPVHARSQPIDLKGPTTKYYNLQVYPYPPEPGGELQVKVATPIQVEKATAVFGWFAGRYRVPLHFERSAWRGVLSVPENAPPGWHLVFVYLKGKETQKASENSPLAWVKSFFSKIWQRELVVSAKVWVEVAPKPIDVAEQGGTGEAIAREPQISPEIAQFVTPPIPSEDELSKTEAPGISRVSREGAAPGVSASGARIPPFPEERAGRMPAALGGGVFRSDASSAPGGAPTLPGVKFPELPDLKITGSKIINFGKKTREGSREGFTEGESREEALRLNVKGKLVNEIEVDADLLNTSTIGAAITGERQDKVNVHLKRQELEAFLGDLEVALTDVEFAKLSKRLSGVRVKGNYPQFGFTLFSATPQGQSKIFKSYGDGTTGPYRLGASPVVIDSERVTLDSVPQKRGEDYTIDYNAGSVTFRKQPIIRTQIIEAAFDQRQTSYPHQTVGGRVTGKPTSWLSVGASYLNDSDLPDPTAVQAATGTGSGSSTVPNPESHHVAGFDTSLMLGEYGILSGEFAFSEKNRNTLGSTPAEMGRAGKVALESQYGPWSLKGHFRRVSPLFLPIADPSAKQDLTQHAATLGLQPFPALRLETGYSKEKYRLSGSPYDTQTRTHRVKLSPDGWPSLSYAEFQNQELTDPVSASRIERKTSKKEGEARYRFRLAELSLATGEEKREDQAPTRATTIFKTVRSGVTFLGIDPFTLSGDLELKETELPDGRRPTTRTTSANVSVSPFKEYTLVGSVHHIDDSLQGVSSASEMSYRAEPASWIRSEGKWNVSSLSETLGATREAVLKQVGSFQIESRLPLWGTRLRYYYRPESKRVDQLGAALMDNNSHQIDVNFTPIPELSLGLTQKISQSMNADPSDYPRFARVQNSGVATSRIYSVKIAPLRLVTLELTQTLDDSVEDRLKSGSVPGGGLLYDRSEADNKKIEAALRTSLSDLFSIDTRYTRERSTAIAPSAGQDKLTQTGALKLLWNATSMWTFQGGTSFSKTTDFRSTENRDSFVVTPTLGCSLRDGNRARVDFDYSYSKSTYGAPQELSIYNMRAKYDLVDAVSVTFRGEQQVGVTPQFFRTSDFAGSVELKL